MEFGDYIVLNQFIGHYDISEIYVNLLAGTLLFLASAATLLITHIRFLFEWQFQGNTITIRTDQTEIFSIRSPVLKGFTLAVNTQPGLLGWKSITAGIFLIGLVGLGEAMEHLVKTQFNSVLFHYLHIIAAPLALYHIREGITFHAARKPEPVIMPKVILSIVAILFISSFFAGLTETSVGNKVEEYFLYIIVIPISIYFGMIFSLVRKLYKDHPIYVPTVAAMVVFITLATIFALIARFAYFLDYPELYVLSHSLKDLSLAVSAAGVLMYTAGTLVMRRQLGFWRVQAT